MCWGEIIHTTGQRLNAFCHSIQWGSVSKLFTIVYPFSTLCFEVGNGDGMLLFHKCLNLFKRFQKAHFSWCDGKHMLCFGKRPKWWWIFIDLVGTLLFLSLSLTSLLPWLCFGLLYLHNCSPLQHKSIIGICLIASQCLLAPCCYLVCGMTETVNFSGLSPVQLRMGCGFRLGRIDRENTTDGTSCSFDLSFLPPFLRRPWVQPANHSWRALLCPCFTQCLIKCKHAWEHLLIFSTPPHSQDSCCLIDLVWCFPC